MILLVGEGLSPVNRVLLVVVFSSMSYIMVRHRR